MSCLLTLAFRRRSRLSRLAKAREVGKITKEGWLGLGGVELLRVRHKIALVSAVSAHCSSFHIDLYSKPLNSIPCEALNEKAFIFTNF